KGVILSLYSRSRCCSQRTRGSRCVRLPNLARASTELNIKLICDVNCQIGKQCIFLVPSWYLGMCQQADRRSGGWICCQNVLVDERVFVCVESCDEPFEFLADWHRESNLLRHLGGLIGVENIGARNTEQSECGGTQCKAIVGGVGIRINTVTAYGCQIGASQLRCHF